MGLNFLDLKTEKQYKEEYSFLKEVDSIALQQVRLHLVDAYKRFGKGQNEAPVFKSKRKKQSYSTVMTNGNIKIDFSVKKLKIPKFGWINYSDDRIFNGRVLNVTVKKTNGGNYYASVLVEEEIVVPVRKESNKVVIGIDMGLRTFITDNQGTKYTNPKFYRKVEEKIAKEQRKLDKMVRGSCNYEKQLKKLNRLHEHLKNQRSNHHHQLSFSLVMSNDVIVIEDLNFSAMAQSLNLGKSVHDTSWGSFRDMLEYKADWYGKEVYRVPKMFASSKICNGCGIKNPSLELKDENWVCLGCGKEHDRDMNAAINLKNYYLKNLSTVGTTGINACGDPTEDHLKQESMPYLAW